MTKPNAQPRPGIALGPLRAAETVHRSALRSNSGQRRHPACPHARAEAIKPQNRKLRLPAVMRPV